jgi:hypothetical protein
MGLPYPKKQYTEINRLFPGDHETGHGKACKCVRPCPHGQRRYYPIIDLFRQYEYLSHLDAGRD